MVGQFWVYQSAHQCSLPWRSTINSPLLIYPHSLPWVTVEHSSFYCGTSVSNKQIHSELDFVPLIHIPSPFQQQNLLPVKPYVQSTLCSQELITAFMWLGSPWGKDDQVCWDEICSWTVCMSLLPVNHLMLFTSRGIWKNQMSQILD